MNAMPVVVPGAAEIQELADWYGEHCADLEAWSKALWHAKRRLTEYVKDNGPIRTEHGLVGITPDGWDWDDAAVALALPALVSGETLTVEGSRSDIEEVLSTVAVMPNVTYTLARKIDKVAAARVIREGGHLAESLEACRSPRGRLGVR